MHWRAKQRGETLEQRIAELEERITRMTAATDRLGASINALSAAVDTAVATITALPGQEDSTVNGYADTVDAITAKLNKAEPAAPASTTNAS